VRVQTRFRRASYVVMPEHVHLLIEEHPAQRPRRVGTHVT
jgi:REP element-mobilizing transposase RayT